jgi:hypothetical protein
MSIISKRVKGDRCRAKTILEWRYVGKNTWEHCPEGFNGFKVFLTLDESGYGFCYKLWSNFNEMFGGVSHDFFRKENFKETLLLIEEKVKSKLSDLRLFMEKYNHIFGANTVINTKPNPDKRLTISKSIKGKRCRIPVRLKWNYLGNNEWEHVVEDCYPLTVWLKIEEYGVLMSCEMRANDTLSDISEIERQFVCV